MSNCNLSTADNDAAMEVRGKGYKRSLFRFICTSSVGCLRGVYQCSLSFTETAPQPQPCRSDLSLQKFCKSTKGVIHFTYTFHAMQAIPPSPPSDTHKRQAPFSLRDASHSLTCTPQPVHHRPDSSLIVAAKSLLFVLEVFYHILLQMHLLANLRLHVHIYFTALLAPGRAKSGVAGQALHIGL